MNYKPLAIWIGLENFNDQEVELLKANLKLYQQNKVILNEKVQLSLLHVVEFGSEEDNQLPDLTLNIYHMELPLDHQVDSERLTLEILSEDVFILGPQKRKVIKPCILDVNYIKDWGEIARNEIGLESDTNSIYAESHSTWYEFISTMGNSHKRKQQKYIKVGDSKLAYISVEINRN